MGGARRAVIESLAHQECCRSAQEIFDQLRTFDRIVRDQSFTRAAAHLNITQATASMRIRALEQLLGVQLFVRGRTVTLKVKYGDFTLITRSKSFAP